MVKKSLFLFAALLVAIIAASCASGPKSAEVDFKAVDPIPADKAVVYFYQADPIVINLNPLAPTKAEIAIGPESLGHTGMFDNISDVPGFIWTNPRTTAVFVVDPSEKNFTFTYTVSANNEVTTNRVKLPVTLTAGAATYYQVQYVDLGKIVTLTEQKDVNDITKKMQAGKMRLPATGK